MKKVFCLLLSVSIFFSAFAQSDEDLFGSSDDEFFDDGIIEVTEEQTKNTATMDLSKGILFQTGSVKIGGAFDLSLSTLTTFRPDYDFGTAVARTYLIPKADASLYVDAHPTDNLRLYGKAGVHYPYISESGSTLVTKEYDGNNFVIDNSSDVFAHLFYIKELFADFNIGKNVAFRFGKQTVSWGVGYFYSPADVINLTRIDPENPESQVEGPLALRSQIVFPGSQNAIWAYVIPDNNFAEISNGVGTYLIDTAAALKGDIVIKDWELGLGGWIKRNNPARLMMTFSGTLFRNYGVFGEAVIAFGRDNIPYDYTPAFQGTVGFMRTWTKQNITLASQYYYNGQLLSSAGNSGHNLAVLLAFNKLFVSDLSASVFGMFNFDNSYGTAFCTLTYSPIKEFSVSAGPYFVYASGMLIPSIRLSFNLGSGKF